MDRLRAFLRDWPVVELALLLLVIGAISSAWSLQEHEAVVSDTTRQLIANTIVYVLNGTMAVASIILSGALIGLQAAQHLPTEAKTHVRHSVGWVIVSIIVGAWDLALLPSRVGGHNLAYDGMVAIFGTVQLFSMIYAAVRLLFVVRIALR